MQTRSQRDAIKVLAQIESINKKNDKELSKRYAILVNRFPIMVRQNGLQQAVGFIQGKAAGDVESAEHCFLQHIANLLDLDADNLSLQIAETTLSEYRFYTLRCLEAAIWYRRFSESILGVDSTGQSLDAQEQSNAN